MYIIIFQRVLTGSFLKPKRRIFIQTRPNETTE